MTRNRTALRDLRLPWKVLIAGFLVAVAIGYLFMLLRFHLPIAWPGKFLLGPGDQHPAHSRAAVSTLERLLETSEGPLNASGTMRPAFTDQSDGWNELVGKSTPKQLERLHAEREGERRALLSWVRQGGDRVSYERDEFPLDANSVGRAVTPDLLLPGDPSRIRIQSLITRRCVTCHGEDGRREQARSFPFETYEGFERYLQIEPEQPRSISNASYMLLPILLFIGAFCATGALCNFTAYPPKLQMVIGLLPIALEAVDLGCRWWVRDQPSRADLLGMSGMAVALALIVQFGAILRDLFQGRRQSGA